MDNISQILNTEELNNVVTGIDDSLERLSLAITTADTVDVELTNESAEAVSQYIGYDLSIEADELSVFKGKLAVLYADLNGFIFKKFKKFGPLTNLASEYKVNELKKLRADIDNGVLIPVNAIDAGKVSSLNNKLGMFYASGYSLTKGCGDMTTFFNGMITTPNKSGKYMNGLSLMYDKLNAPTPTLVVPKLNGLLNVRNQLVGVKETVVRKRKINDFRLAIVNKWLTDNVELVMVSNAPKRGIKVHTDKFLVDTNKQIGVPNKSQTLKLLDLGLRLNGMLPVIHKALSFSIKKMTRDNTIQLMKSASGSGGAHRFLVARYSESVVKANINMYKDITNIDNVIMTYIKLTYVKAPK